MFIKQVDILNFRSVNWMSKDLDPGHIFAELPQVPDLDQRDFVDAIRFVMDPSFVADFRGYPPNRGYVRLYLYLHNSNVRPTIFKYYEDKGIRKLFVKRLINEDTECDVTLDFIGETLTMDIHSFHMLWYGNVPVTSSKMNLLALGQSMRNQFFCLANANREYYIHECQNRFDDNCYAYDSLCRSMKSFDLLADQVIDIEALIVVLSRRKEPALRATLNRFEEELHDLPHNPKSIAKANFRLLCLSLEKILIKLKMIQRIVCSEERAHIDAHMANAEFNIKRKELNLQIPDKTYEQIDASIVDAHNTFETLREKEDTICELQLENHRLAMHLVALKCSQLSEDDMNRLVNESLVEKIRTQGVLNTIIDVSNANVHIQEDVVQLIKIEIEINEEDANNLNSQLGSFYDTLLELNETRFKQQMEISTARIALQENRLNDLYQETMLMVFDSDVLFAYESLKSVILDVRADPLILDDFVGFVIEFISFKDGFTDLANKIQYALNDILLIAIFKTNSSLDSIAKLLKERCLTYESHRLISIERYQSVNLPLGLPMCPVRGISLLTDYLNPITCDVVLDMLNSFIVINTDAYTVEEAAGIFQRHVICANTGLYKYYNDVNTYLGLSCDNRVTVFDGFADETNRVDLLVKINDWERNRLHNENHRLMVQRKIDKLELNLKRLNFNRFMLLHNLQFQDIILFIQQHSLSKIDVNRKILENNIRTCQSVLEKDFACDSESISRQFSQLTIGEQLMQTENQMEQDSLRNVIEFCLSLSGVQPVKVQHTLFDNLNNLICQMQESKASFTDESNSNRLSADKCAKLERKMTKINENLNHANILQQSIVAIQHKLKKMRDRETQLNNCNIDWEKYEHLTDEMIKNELRTLIKKAEISKIEIIMKKRLRVKKFMDKLKTSRKCLIGLFATLPITNHQHSVAQYKMLSSVVKTMNTLMPMVYHMGSTEFKKATLKLFLIFDNKTIGRCELEESLVLDAQQIRAFEFVVHNAKSASEIAIGRHETRCIALLWHVAACVASKNQSGIIILHELLDSFTSDQRIQIFHVLRQTQQLVQCQTLVVAR